MCQLEKLIEGEWYWIREDSNGSWFVAKRDDWACGGWANDDTWEDFDMKVKEWRHIQRPNKD